MLNTGNLMSKRKMFYKLFFVCCVLLISPWSSAQEQDENKVYRINSIDHDKHDLWINDKHYRMLISLDVYSYDSKKRIKRKVNRYALQADQIVFFKKVIRQEQAYVKEITIFK